MQRYLDDSYQQPLRRRIRLKFGCCPGVDHSFMGMSMLPATRLEPPQASLRHSLAACSCDFYARLGGTPAALWLPSALSRRKVPLFGAEKKALETVP
jgi:hypothetical protein